ncbi:hypothetical protein ES705_06168 [subsurface metagenome]|nr:ferredoxin [Clostridia bacterium]
MAKNSRDAETEGVLHVANLMCVAARTAPKARGIDNIVSTVLTDKEKDSFAQKMEEFGKKTERAAGFARDANCVRQAQAVVLIGTKFDPAGLDCGFCGFDNCKKCDEARARCAHNSGDLGIAVGSAVSIASNHRVDNRVMYTVGWTSVEGKILGEKVKMVLGIPLSASGKNIFFDRK